MLSSRQSEGRLAAIVVADVVGYSRLMAEDERATLEAMKAHRRDLWMPKIGEFGGRLVGSAGDGILVEFRSAVAAVEFWVEIQRGMTDRNAAVPEKRRMLLRVGINLGEVIVEGDDIYGDGVNVAARLEALATAGGICASDDVLRQVRGGLDVAFADGGPKTVRNIPRPVHVWHWSAGWKTSGIRDDCGSGSATAGKPSIVVLPLVDLSADGEPGHLADGITGDIIAGLSRFRSLFVIARNSSFAYKDRCLDVREVASDLGVRYVLEGTVRQGGGRILVTVQLIDATTGNSLWAERHDRPAEDIFAVQDELTDAIVGAIAPEVGEAERARARRKSPGDPDTWNLYQRGLASCYSSTEAGLATAIGQFDEVTELDPDFAPAFAMAAGARWRYVLHFDPDDRTAILKLALAKACTAITLDPRDPAGFWNAGEIHSMLGEHESGLSKVREAIVLNPTDAMARYFLGSILRRAGRAEEAIPHFDAAMRLSPRDIFTTGMLTDRAFVLFQLERHEEALEWAGRARLGPNPRTMTFAVFAALLSTLGRENEARAAVADLLVHAPGLTCSRYCRSLFGPPEVMERLTAALARAGLPE